MAAPAGNQFWKQRSSHGRKPLFSNPDDLWDACEQYFQWVEANPLKESKLTSCKGEPTVVELPKMRAMTLGGLQLFIDIDDVTWLNWRKNRKDLFSVIARVDEIIRHQKFTGAAADLLNANIIARDLGLSDKSELSGPGGGPVETKDVTPRKRAMAIANILSRATKAEKT